MDFGSDTRALGLLWNEVWKFAKILQGHIRPPVRLSFGRPSAAPTASSCGGMSDRAHGEFGVDDLTRLLGDRKS